MTFRCLQCGGDHKGYPELGFRWPDYYAFLSAEERAQFAECDSDVCIITDRDHGQVDRFIRCVLQIRIRGATDTYGIGLWMSVSEASLSTYLAFGRGEIAEMPYVTGYISNNIHGLPECLRLVARARAMSPTQRPILELKSDEHPIVRMWYDGVEREDLERALSPILHGRPGEGSDWESAFETLARRAHGTSSLWRLPITPVTGVYTQLSVMRDRSPVLLVCHEEDGTWQFLDGGAADAAEAVLCCAADIADADPSLHELHDLTSGWCAWRPEPGAPWIREQMASDEYEEA